MQAAMKGYVHLSVLYIPRMLIYKLPMFFVPQKFLRPILLLVGSNSTKNSKSTTITQIRSEKTSKAETHLDMHVFCPLQLTAVVNFLVY